MRERCRVCNRRKRMREMYDTHICVECRESWWKFSRMAVRGL
jgi:hypothetical protein